MIWMPLPEVNNSVEISQVRGLVISPHRESDRKLLMFDGEKSSGLNSF
jgi:hypothetical protein